MTTKTQILNKCSSQYYLYQLHDKFDLFDERLNTAAIINRLPIAASNEPATTCAGSDHCTVFIAQFTL